MWQCYNVIYAFVGKAELIIYLFLRWCGKPKKHLPKIGGFCHQRSVFANNRIRDVLKD